MKRPNYLLGVFSLAGSRLTSDENGLILADIHHTLVGALSNTKDVRRAFIPPQSHVDFHSTLGVDRKPNVRIDGNAEKARIGVNELVLVPNHGIPQDTTIAQIG